MKRFLTHIIALFFCVNSFSQIHEIGVFVGGSNYIGDLGPTDYFASNEMAIGALYKWNRSTRHSWRFSYNQASITSNDVDSNVPSRNLRGFTFKNSVKEFSAGLEFNFFDFDLHQSGFLISPYVHSGLNVFIYDEIYIINKESEEDYQSYSFAIPMTVGVKAKIADHFVLGFETGARYTFTDNLDGSNPKNENLKPLQFGNLNNKDWYIFTGFTLTYTFGQNPCFCADK